MAMGKEELTMEEKDFMDTLWKYFELHANQRMQVMNFYIVIVSLFFTALVAMFCSDKDMRMYESVLCVAVIFFSWIFMMFDKRTRSMIKNCEKAIKKIEMKHMEKFGAEIMIFTQEELQTEIKKEMTFTKIMKLEFGFVITAMLLCLLGILKSWLM